MIHPTTPIPPNETERLLAVQRYVQLPLKQQIFQAVVELTARMFVAPMSIMSLVEAEQVQYPGSVGLPLPEYLPRIDCICSSAVYTSTITIFDDLWQTPCPWVSAASQGQTDFQFYAGHPLLTANELAIGTLCVLDRERRPFPEPEQHVLRQLARVAMRLLDLNLLLASQPQDSPRLWMEIEDRITFSIRRIETLQALAQRATGAAAEAYRADIHAERLLIIQDISHNIEAAFAQTSFALE